MSDILEDTRKACPQCGHANRLTAKICMNCGYAFPVEVPDMTHKRCPDCGTENRLSAKVCIQCGHTLPTNAATLPDPAGDDHAQKWCPTCGTVSRLDAKVCTHCGHRFRTVAVKSAPARSADTMPTETPIMQPLPDSLELTPHDQAPFDAPGGFQFDPPPARIDPLPPAPTLAPPPDLHDGAPEPAPDLSDMDFDALRRTSPAHTDQRGRLGISLFKKDRS